MLIIYYTKDLKCYQTVRPSPAFTGDWKALTDAITGSFTEPSGNYVKFYYKYDIIV